MRKKILTLSLALTLILSACQRTPAQQTPTSNPATQTPSPVPSPTLTPIPPTPAPRTLVVCIGQEPQSLYLYSQPSVAAWNILEAIYDGPIDEQNYTAQPVILQKIPSLADGDAAITGVPVSAGDEIIDANGNLATLAKDVPVRPAGCNSTDCAIPWDGSSELQMDQLRVTFKLLPGLLWSDGQPLTAADSVFSYKLAADPTTPSSKYNIDRTAAYTAVDDLTVQWVGIPGNLSPGSLTNFWLPLPQHLWGNMSPSELLTASESTTTPIGWGPYQIVDWVKGDHITLHKNPNYFKAKDGLPTFDNLVYRFIGTDTNTSLTALLAGECDIVDRSAQLDSQISTLLELQANHKIQAYFTAGPEVELIDFGIMPASYDNGYNPAAGDRPDYFGDVRTRQAFAYCMDRQTIIDQALQGQSQVIDTYLPPQNPLSAADVAHYGFDVAQGSQLLDEVGWKDSDNDPSTPRLAQGVAGVPDGTPLVVDYWTTQAALRSQVASILSQSLGECGIQLNVHTETPENLFAPGPQGPVFGRNFDLVDFSWQGSIYPQCFLYLSSNVPNDGNHWLGENVSGYANPQFDQACTTALQGPPGQTSYIDANRTAQDNFRQRPSRHSALSARQSSGCSTRPLWSYPRPFSPQRPLGPRGHRLRPGLFQIIFSYHRRLTFFWTHAKIPDKPITNG